MALQVISEIGIGIPIFGWSLELLFMSRYTYPCDVFCQYNFLRVSTLSSSSIII